MKTLSWILAGVGIGLVTYIALNQPEPQYATGNDDIEDAADKTSLWGSKQRIAAAGGTLFGKLKEGAGNVTGNDQLADEGVADQVVGAVKDTAGSAAQNLGQAIHQLNR